VQPPGDELMGHEATGRSRQQQGSAMGAHCRHTTRRWPPGGRPIGGVREARA
jgi:hypothetical protein